MGRQQQQRKRRERRAREARRGGRPPIQPPKRGVGRGTIALGVVVVVLVLGGLAYAATRQTPSPAATPTAVAGPAPVDGIQCGDMEQLNYHIHQHLALYKNGKPVPVPSEIGIPGGENFAQCFYWIHVHASTPGIIHVESPIKKVFTLGNFFDIWKATAADAQPPGDAYVKQLRAHPSEVTAFLNGKRWSGSYRSIPLKSHAVITVEIGTPVVPPRPFHNWNGL